VGMGMTSLGDNRSELPWQVRESRTTRAFHTAPRTGTLFITCLSRVFTYPSFGTKPGEKPLRQSIALPSIGLTSLHHLLTWNGLACACACACVAVLIAAYLTDRRVPKQVYISGSISISGALNLRIL
jgi:hypothetical protein